MTEIIFAIAVSAALHILADSRQIYAAIYIFKPLTLLLILALAASRFDLYPSYSVLVLCGLTCSLAGDVALMLRRRRFTLGLACFLVAHLFYIGAFAQAPAQLLPLVALGVILAAYAIAVYCLLASALGRLKPAVLAYLIVLLVMLLAAVNRCLSVPAPNTMLAAVGAALFVVSDSLLAFRQFRRSFPSAQFLILSTYYAAQTLIALG